MIIYSPSYFSTLCKVVQGIISYILASPIFLDYFFRINDQKWKYRVKEYKHSMKLIARLLLSKISIYKFASTYNLSSSGYYSFFNANLKECMWGGITMLFQFILLFLLIRLNICPHYLLVNCIFFSLAFRALYNLNLPFSPYLLLVKPTNIY